MNHSKIYVGNLPYSTTSDELNELFSQYGSISEVKLISDRHTGRSKGFAFISFENQKDAEAALAASDTEFQGRRIKVNMAKEQSRSGGDRRGGGDRRW